LVAAMDDIRLARVHAVIGRNPLIIEPTSRVARGTDAPTASVESLKAQQAQAIDAAIGAADEALINAYNILLGLSTHDISAMRELIGLPQRVLYAAQRWNGRFMSAAFDYGSYVCQFETGADTVPRFDARLEGYGGPRD